MKKVSCGGGYYQRPKEVIREFNWRYYRYISGDYDKKKKSVALRKKRRNIKNKIIRFFVKL